MNRKERIERIVQRTLESLDQFDTIKAGPYFYSRILKKMETAEKKDQATIFLTFKAVLRPACLALLIALNLVSFIYILKDWDGQKITRKEYLSELAEECTIQYPASEILEINQ